MRTGYTHTPEFVRWLIWLGEEFFHWVHQHRSVHVTFDVDGKTLEGDMATMDLTCTKKRLVKGRFRDDAGVARAPEAGSVQWSTLTPGNCDVEAQPDGTDADGPYSSAFVKGLGDGVGLGAGQVKMAGDADLGAGVRSVEGVLDVNVHAVEATNAGFEFGPEEDL